MTPQGLREKTRLIFDRVESRRDPLDAYQGLGEMMRLALQAADALEAAETRMNDREAELTRIHQSHMDLSEECYKLRERAEQAEKRLAGATEAWGCYREIGPKPGDALQLVTTGTKYEMQNLAMAAEVNARAVRVLIIPAGNVTAQVDEKSGNVTT